MSVGGCGGVRRERDGGLETLAEDRRTTSATLHGCTGVPPGRAHLPISPQGALAQGGGWRSGAGPLGLRHLYLGAATSARGSFRAADSESRPVPEIQMWRLASAQIKRAER